MATEATEGGIEGLSARMQRHPRDLLRHFSGTGCLDEAPKGAGGGSAEIELSLGLSLGGCFGVEPGERRLVRSSSIAALSMFPEEHELAAAVLPIARTCSLPVDTEEEHRKRKELQSLKRLEAKRKRSEKRRSRSGARDPKGENLDEDTKASGFPGFPTASLIGGAANGVAPPVLPAWSVAAGRAAAHPVDAPRCFGPVSQGSAGSQGSSSSSVSDFESRMRQGIDISGLSSSTEVKSPSIVASPLDRTNQKPTTTNPATAERNPIKPFGGGDDLSKKKAEVANGTMEMERSMMEEMPCVSTRGDGPNGRRVEGFLYKYRKGEEVRIVCVCHGSFLTPAEFVRHAGGGDVTHPLRHIVVNPSPPAFL